MIRKCHSILLTTNMIYWLTTIERQFQWPSTTNRKWLYYSNWMDFVKVADECMSITVTLAASTMCGVQLFVFARGTRDKVTAAGRRRAVGNVSTRRMTTYITYTVYTKGRHLQHTNERSLHIRWIDKAHSHMRSSPLIRWLVFRACPQTPGGWGARGRWRRGGRGCW